MRKEQQLTCSRKLLVIASFLVCTEAASPQFPPAAPVVMVVNAQDVRSDVSRHPLGINVDYMTDRPSLFAPGARPLGAALQDLGVHYVRYPGGEKSQSSLWSTPPFEGPRPALSRTGPKEFWSSLRTYTKRDGKTLINPMDFDEFMTLCQQIDCVPDLVVNHNSYLGPKTSPDATVPSRNQLIETAAAWVHYANVTRHYDVRYWEIGNETYLSAYNGPRQNPSAYGVDVHAFSQAMKHEDPSIKVGLGGNTYEYFRDALKVAADDVDFLIVHSYPCCASYTAYQHTARFDGAAEPARKALADLTAAQRSHITMALTEVNALDFLPGRKDVNDLGHAMLLFEILAQYMTYDPDVEFEEVWNTRWIDNNKTSSPPSIFDVLDNTNHMNAIGIAMSLLGHGLLTKMVGVTMQQGDGLITGYATTDGATQMRVWVVNRDLRPRSLTVDLSAFVSKSSGETHIFTGNGFDDIHPEIHERNPVKIRRGRCTLSLPGASIVELTLSK
jgi:hypothetical protein